MEFLVDCERRDRMGFDTLHIESAEFVGWQRDRLAIATNSNHGEDSVMAEWSVDVEAEFEYQVAAVL